VTKKTSTLDEFESNSPKWQAKANLILVVKAEKLSGNPNSGSPYKKQTALIGETWCGKTAIAEGLASRIANKDIPDI